MKRYTGEEVFSFNGNDLGKMTLSFWSWAYSELESNILRSALAEYIVALALDITENADECYRKTWRPYDLGFMGRRIEVKSASTVQAWETRHKGKYTFSIAPASLPNENDNYEENAPKQRNSDVYVFAIFEPKGEEVNPLNLDGWHFVVISTRVLDENMPLQKTISMPSLLRLDPIETDFAGLKSAVLSCI